MMKTLKYALAAGLALQLSAPIANAQSNKGLENPRSTKFHAELSTKKVTAQVPQGIIFLPQESKCDSLRL